MKKTIQFQILILFLTISNNIVAQVSKGSKEDIALRSPQESYEIEPSIFRNAYLNKDLPKFSLTDINGEKISSDNLKGKIVHINFWSISCKPCIEEFPDLNRLKKKYEHEGVVFLAFVPESDEKVRKIIAHNPINYIVIPNAENYYQQLGIDKYPINFFIDKKGKIAEVTEGVISTTLLTLNEKGEGMMSLSSNSKSSSFSNFDILNQIIIKMINQNN